MLDRLFDVDIGATTISHSIHDHAMFEANCSPYYPYASSPFFLDLGQLYYWKHSWQAGERETREALGRGEGKTFLNAQEAIKWLLSDDE